MELICITQTSCKVSYHPTHAQYNIGLTYATFTLPQCSRNDRPVVFRSTAQPLNVGLLTIFHSRVHLCATILCCSNITHRHTSLRHVLQAEFRPLGVFWHDNKQAGWEFRGSSLEPLFLLVSCGQTLPRGRVCSNT